MLKRGWILGFAVVLLLTGCGAEDKLLSYIDEADFGMVDTKEQAEALCAKLDKKDDVEWIYYKEHIDKLMQLDEVLKEQPESKGYKVKYYYSGYQAEDMTIWKTHMEAGLDPREEETEDVSIQIYTSKKKTMNQLSQRIEKLGYSGVAGFRNGKSINSQGIVFSCWKEYEDSTMKYEMEISISSSFLFGPKVYEEILDTIQTAGYAIAEGLYQGGALDLINFVTEDEKRLCQSANIFLDSTKGIVELDACFYLEDADAVCSEKEKKVLVELLTNLTGDRDESVSLVDSLSRQGNRKGTIGEHSWKFTRRMVDEYILRVQ